MKQKTFNLASPFDKMNVPAGRGIYRIVCLPTGEEYVGATDNFRNRCAGHRTTIIHGRHHAIRLRELSLIWDISNFAFEIVERVPRGGVDHLQRKEVAWMQIAQGENRLLNSALFSSDCRRGRHSRIYPEASEKQRRDKIRAAAFSRFMGRMVKTMDQSLATAGSTF